MSVLLAYARTPFARFNGQLASLSASALGAHAIRAALQRSGISLSNIDAVVGGQVLQAATGQNPVRQAAVGAGISLTVPALTLNSVCLSGLEAVIQAHRLVSSGEASVVVAVGQESMSAAPHALIGSRAGTAFGAITAVDTLQTDGLTDAFDHHAMGLGTDLGNEALGIDRATQDAWAVRSHHAAASAQEFVQHEIVPVEVVARKATTIVSTDDGIRADTSLDKLSALRPAFHADGTITAGNASPITDGAAAVVVVSDSFAARHHLDGLARIVAHAVVAGPDTRLHSQPARAIVRAVEGAGWTTPDLAAVEVNEAFASVTVQSVRELSLDPSIVNANGGAIALGHPIGASGARIAGHLARRLEAGERGAAAICGGGGQGAAVLLQGL